MNYLEELVVSCSQIHAVYLSSCLAQSFYCNKLSKLASELILECNNKAKNIEKY